MTVSAAERFTIVSTSGESWNSGGTDLIVGGDGSDYVTLPDGTTTYANLSVPDFITDIIDGAKFVSLKIEFDEKTNDSRYVERHAYLTGGTTFSNTSLPTFSYTTVTLDGDASYWGISGTANSIFSDLKDGTLKFTIKGVGDGGTFPILYINDVKATLTYRLPNTTTASTITLIP